LINCFYDTIYGLRQREEIVLYNKLLDVNPAEARMVIDFLENEYCRECLGYPFKPPSFEPAAALWAAKTTYIFSQLIINRDHQEADLQKLLPLYDGMVNAGAILSADLCLRFLIELVPTFSNIDADDPILQLFTTHLHQWHYSGIGYDLNIDKLNMEMVTGDNCLMQLYANRVVEKRDSKRAMIPGLYQWLKAGMGIYAPLFWKELKTVVENE
jgi:hypothetical protein